MMNGYDDFLNFLIYLDFRFVNFFFFSKILATNKRKIIIKIKTYYSGCRFLDLIEENYLNS